MKLYPQRTEELLSSETIENVLFSDSHEDSFIYLSLDTTNINNNPTSSFVIKKQTNENIVILFVTTNLKVAIDKYNEIFNK